jgi:hypothetical protein
MSSVTLAADWADPLSAVAAVLSVIATLYVGWLAYRAAVPHRKIGYELEFTPLLSSTHAGLTVSLDTERLAQPQTATLKIANTGTREIQPATFNGESMEFQLGVRVVSVLESSSTDSRRVLPYTIRGDSLHIEPYVLHRRQEVTYKLLLDGEIPSRSLTHSLSARVVKGIQSSASRGAPTLVAGIAAAVTIGIGALFLVDSNPHDIPANPEQAYRKGVHDGIQMATSRGGTGGGASSSPSSMPSPSPR